MGVGRPLFLVEPQSTVPNPTGINTNPGTTFALVNYTVNTVIATLTMVGGTGTPTFSVSGNSNFKIVGNQLQVNTSPSFSAGVNETFTLGVTTTTGGSYTDPSPRTIIIPGAPTAIGLSGSTITSTAAAGTVVGALSATGSPYSLPYVYSVDTNTKF